MAAGVPLTDEVLSQFVPDRPLTAAEVESATRQSKQALIERALRAELSHHLGYPPGAARPEDRTHHRNGTSGKTVLTDDGPVGIDVPRDRHGMAEALAVVYPATTRQTCGVHLVRNSRALTSWKDRKPLAAALRTIDTAPTAAAAD